MKNKRKIISAVISILVLISVSNSESFSKIEYLKKLKKFSTNGRLMYNSKVFINQDINKTIQLLGQPKKKYNLEWSGYLDYGKFAILLPDYLGSKSNTKCDGFLYFFPKKQINLAMIYEIFGKSVPVSYNFQESRFEVHCDLGKFTLLIFLQSQKPLSGEKSPPLNDNLFAVGAENFIFKQ